MVGPRTEVLASPRIGQRGWLSAGVVVLTAALVQILAPAAHFEVRLKFLLYSSLFTSKQIYTPQVFNKALKPTISPYMTRKFSGGITPFSLIMVRRILQR